MTLPREPTGHDEDMGAHCEFCGGKSFRRSHLQFKDLPLLLLFRYPVRCHLCSKRQAVSFLVAYRAVPSTVKQVRAPRDEAWKGWNASAGGIGSTAQAGADERSFSTLPARTPISMPELRGMTLKHIDDASTSRE